MLCEIHKNARSEEIVGDDEGDDAKEDVRSEPHSPVHLRVAERAEADVCRAMHAALHQVVAEPFVADDSIRSMHESLLVELYVLYYVFSIMSNIVKRPYRNLVRYNEAI